MNSNFQYSSNHQSFDQRQDKNKLQTQQSSDCKFGSNSYNGQDHSSSLQPSIINHNSNMKGAPLIQQENQTSENARMSSCSQDMLKQFLVKLFQNEKIMSLADARLAIEQKFEDNFKPNRDLLDYLIEKQSMAKKNQKQAAAFQTKGVGDIIRGRSKAKAKEQMIEGINGLVKRRKSNVSMNDVGYDSAEIGSLGSDGSNDYRRHRRSMEEEEEYGDQDMLQEEYEYFGRHLRENASNSSDEDRPRYQRRDLQSDDDMMDVDEGSLETPSLKGQNSAIKKVKESKFLAGIDDPKSYLNEEETKGEQEEIKQEKKQMSMIEKCKITGRIGALISKLHFEESKGEIRQYDQERLEIESLSSFSSIRANTAVFQGKYYYEVRLLSNGLMQIGWCSLLTPFSEHNGVGDDDSSYAYDGFRIKKWNKTVNSYGKRWQVGDVIGTLIDIDKRQITFYRNDECLGVAFKNIKIGPNCAYFPAISLQQGQRVVFNFGSDIPFRNRQHYDVCAIQEPQCHIKSYFSCAFYLIDLLKRYVMSTNQEFQELNYDQKLMVGSIIWEYLYPLLIDDSYLMEDQLVQFIFDSQNIQIPGLVEIILDSMEIHFSNDQVLKWTAALMKIICRRASNINITYSDTVHKREFELSLLKFAVAFLKRDSFLYSWIKSQHFDKDFENLYTMNLPNQEDITEIITQVYHELIPGTEKYRIEYENQLEKVILNIRVHQNYLIQITELLMQNKRLRLGNDPTQQLLVPRAVLTNRLSELTQKNLFYLLPQQQKRPGLSSQITLANIFFCVSQFVEEILKESVDLFQFQVFFKGDTQASFTSEALRQIERIGGTYSYMESEIGPQIAQMQKMEISLANEQKAKIMKSLTFLYMYSFSQELSVYIKANEKIYVNSRTYEDLTEEGKQNKGEQLIDEMTSASGLLPQFQMILNIDFNRVALYKFGHWLARVINYVDLKYPGLIYILPEDFMSIPFDIFRASKRGCIPLYEQESESLKLKEEKERALGGFYSTLSEELVSLISRHFYDEKIVNPDLKETYLTRLNILLQSQFIMETFEKCKDSQELLIKGLLCSFDKKYLMLVSKNFLRFSKGRGFKEVALPAKVSENTYSQYFLQKIREELLREGSIVSKNFMNIFFNTLNDMTTELFVIFKELKNNYNGQLLRRTRSTFQLIVDLYRIIEVITKVAPEIFVDKMLIHSVRLINYLMFVLHSIFIGQIDSYIDYFSSKIMQKSENLPQFLAPFIGILTNLYHAVNTLGLSQNSRYDNLADIFQKTDSFDPVLFLKLKEVVKGQLPPVNLDERQVFENFDVMLAEIDMLCQCNKIRKHSIKSQDSAGDNDGHMNDEDKVHQDGLTSKGGEEDFDEEKLCNICYYTTKDSMCVPCGHQTCFKCIQLHTQNSQKCPFCNTEISDIKKL